MFLISRDASDIARDVANDVDFLLWTRTNPSDADHLKVDDVTGLNASHFDRNLPTKILVHGYDDTGTTGWVLNVRNKYLKKGFKQKQNYKFKNIDANGFKIRGEGPGGFWPFSKRRIL